MNPVRDKLILCILVFALWVPSVFASDLSSSNFIIRDPVIGTSGGYSSSGSFTFFGAGNMNLSGFNTSATFIGRYGFLYFPFVNGAVLGAITNVNNINLSWTASTAGVGFSVSGYRTGQSVVSGGSYSFTSVGNVTSAIYASQPVGTYYFVVQTLDAFGAVIATSNEVSATISSTPPPPPLPSSGGGGGGNNPSTGITFSGRAYPGSRVFLLKDAQIAASTVAGGDANFKINLNSLSAGSFVFLLYAEDQAQRRSTLLSFPITLTVGATLDVGGIFFTPTIAIDKVEVKKGDNLTILGQSVPNGEITISVHSDPEMFVKTSSDKYGGYVYNFDTSILDMGAHLTKSKAKVTADISQFGRSVAFKVGTKTVFATAVAVSAVCNMRADLNNDCRVNLIDYSILAFWYKKVSPPASVDLNHDSKVDIIDFSIMAYYWTI